MFADSGDPSLTDAPITSSPTITEPTPCHRCGSAEVVIKRLTGGPHFARVRCLKCGRVTFAKSPWSLDRARAFVMPWGRHRGRQLADLTGTHEGLGYLRWLADGVEGNISTAARILLDHASRTSSDGPSPRKKSPVCGGSQTGTGEATPPLAEPRE